MLVKNQKVGYYQDAISGKIRIYKMPLKRFLFLFSHPAQFLFARQMIRQLKELGHTVHILIKKKDVLENLVRESGLPYINIQPNSRKAGKLHILRSLFERNRDLHRFVKQHPVDLMIGTDASVAQVGRLRGIDTVTVLEDDYAVIKELALLTYPFTHHIVVPEVCDVGRFQSKKIGYPGYMKLAYLAPGMFTPDREKVLLPDEPYYLLRLSALEAHHDSGIKGLNDDILERIISKLEESGRVYISSEKDLKPRFQQYLLRLKPEDIHHYLSFCEMFISDSQSMSVEAALLGVPSIRYSDFEGKISVLNELEAYGLTFGIKPGDDEVLEETTARLLALKNRREEFRERRKKMLAGKIDVTAFFTWFLSEYPESVEKLRKNPDLVGRFFLGDGERE